MCNLKGSCSSAGCVENYDGNNNPYLQVFCTPATCTKVIQAVQIQSLPLTGNSLSINITDFDDQLTSGGVPQPWNCPEYPSGLPSECIKANYQVNLVPDEECATLATGSCSKQEDSGCYGSGVISISLGFVLLFVFLVAWVRVFTTQRARMRPKPVKKKKGKKKSQPKPKPKGPIDQRSLVPYVACLGIALMLFVLFIRCGGKAYNFFRMDLYGDGDCGGPNSTQYDPDDYGGVNATFDNGGCQGGVPQGFMISRCLGDVIVLGAAMPLLMLQVAGTPGARKKVMAMAACCLVWGVVRLITFTAWKPAIAEGKFLTVDPETGFLIALGTCETDLRPQQNNAAVAVFGTFMGIALMLLMIEALFSFRSAIPCIGEDDSSSSSDSDSDDDDEQRKRKQRRKERKDKSKDEKKREDDQRRTRCKNKRGSSKILDDERDTGDETVELAITSGKPKPPPPNKSKSTKSCTSAQPSSGKPAPPAHKKPTGSAAKPPPPSRPNPLRAPVIPAANALTTYQDQEYAVEKSPYNEPPEYNVPTYAAADAPDADLEWFYLDAANQEQGPLRAHNLETLYQVGAVHDGTFVWNETMAEWTAYFKCFRTKGQQIAISRYV